jgi:cyclopropane fatty-acyl-phospholipid synthase-like methyltransferase
MLTSDVRPGPEGWWTDFFMGDHAEFQMALSEQAHDTDAEVRLIRTLTDIAKGDWVLDAPCGQGRHAIRLAQDGIVVTGVDASADMIAQARHDAKQNSVDIRLIQSDMRTAALKDAAFDAALCLGGSFGYFGRRGDQQFLTRISQALKPSGVLLLDAPALEFIRAIHKPKHESIIAGNSVRQHRRLDVDTGLAQIVVTISTTAGEVTRSYFQQLYTTAELCSMLEESGYVVCDTLEASQLTGYASNRGHSLILARRAAT